MIFLRYAESTASVELIPNSILLQLVIGVLSIFLFLFILPKVKGVLLKSILFLIPTISLLMLPLLLTDIAIEANNATRWISIFGFSIQPTEFFKIGSVIFLAYIFSAYKRKVDGNIGATKLITFLIAFFSIVLFFAFIQPDYGYLLVTLAMSLAIIYATSIPNKIFYGGLLVFTFLGSFLIFYVEYIRNRFLILKKYFFDELTTKELRGEGYQLVKGIDSVKDGGAFGRNLDESVQTILLLPEVNTDLIFALIAQKSGFVGASIVLSLFLIFITTCFLLSARMKNRFAYLVCIGISSLFAIEIFLNISVVLGLFIYTGIPLIFFSKGGSSLLATFIGVGIILALSRSNK